MTVSVNEQTSALFRNVESYDAIMELCRKLLLKLKNDGLFNVHTRKEQPYIDAQVDMLLFRPRNIEVYIRECYDELRYRNHVKDNKGKLIKCEAYLAKRALTYTDA